MDGGAAAVGKRLFRALRIRSVLLVVGYITFGGVVIAVFAI